MGNEPDDQTAALRLDEPEWLRILRAFSRRAAVGPNGEKLDWQKSDFREFEHPPPELHPNSAALVKAFATALARKLAEAEQKYGYSDGWASPDWMDECRRQLRLHVDKGDPRDVAAYCAFLWYHGERTSGPPSPPTPPEASA